MTCGRLLLIALYLCDCRSNMFLDSVYRLNLFARKQFQSLQICETLFQIMKDLFDIFCIRSHLTHPSNHAARGREVPLVGTSCSRLNLVFLMPSEITGQKRTLFGVTQKRTTFVKAQA